jgi:hypothetical protein
MMNCLIPLIINLTAYPIDKTDMMLVEQAKVVCKERYNSCLHKFIKKEQYTYHAICKKMK